VKIASHCSLGSRVVICCSATPAFRSCGFSGFSCRAGVWAGSANAPKKPQVRRTGPALHVFPAWRGFGRARQMPRKSRRSEEPDLRYRFFLHGGCVGGSANAPKKPQVRRTGPALQVFPAWRVCGRARQMPRKSRRSEERDLRYMLLSSAEASDMPLRSQSFSSCGGIGRKVNNVSRKGAKSLRLPSKQSSG